MTDETFQSSPQLWNGNGEKIPISFDNSGAVNFNAITRLEDTSNGLIGVALTIDADGVESDTLVSLTQSGAGYMLTPISTQYNRFSIRATEMVGNSTYYVTDDSHVLNDGVIRLVGSSETIAVASLLTGLEGVLDVIVNQANLDESGKMLNVQGYLKTATGETESWIVSISVNPETPTKPSNNFLGLPIQKNQERLVTWTAVDGAVSYTVQINNLDTKTVERKVTVSGTELSLTIANAGNYAIWVQAIGTTDKVSPWSDVLRFEIVNQGPLISFSGTGTQRIISWQVLESAPEYDVWVTSQATGQRVVNVKTSSQSTEVDLPVGIYYVWVRPLGMPTAQPWSGQKTMPIQVEAVEVNATSAVTETVITWTGPANGSYDVWVSLQGTTNAIYRTTVSGNSKEIPELAVGSYTVWVKRLDTPSPWSTSVNFIKGGRPTLSVSGTQVSWTAFSDAVKYELWVSPTTNYDRIPIDPTFVTTVLTDMTGYGLGSGSYRVWVRAVTGGEAMSQWGYAVPFSIA